MRAGALLALVLGVAAGLLAPPAAARRAVLDGRPDALVDLRTADGLALVKGTWRYSDASIVPVASRLPGPDLKASGAETKSFDIVPKAGATDFDDSSWSVVAPTDLERRRGPGRLSFGWYRLTLTLPERLAAFETAGSVAVLEVVVDDLAEVWVDGRLPRTLGQAGGALSAGFNAPNRVVLTQDARPGQRVQVAILAANGPLSDPPSNFIWMRSATIDFYGSPAARVLDTTPLGIVRKQPALDAVVAPGTQVDKLAEGFEFTEGPVWSVDGYLLFSDPNDNTIYRWSPDSPVVPYRVKSGYTGADIARLRQPGSNGLAFDREGRLTVCEHGNRRVTRLERNGTLTVLADRYEGQRLNSPNDLVYRSDGSLYFTDPPFGLPGFHDDPAREVMQTGVYRWADAKLELLTGELSGPNGLAFSPEEKFLYVANWDEKDKVVMRYELGPDGLATSGTRFFDMNDAPESEALDGLKVDSAGNLFVSGPGGVWVLSPEGQHLGTLVLPELPANFAFGEDGRSLFLTARNGLYRIRVGNPSGAR